MTCRLRGRPLLGRPLLGRPLLGRPVLGRPLLGRPVLGRPLLGRRLLIRLLLCRPPMSRPPGSVSWGSLPRSRERSCDVGRGPSSDLAGPCFAFRACARPVGERRRRGVAAPPTAAGRDDRSG